ncbi:nitrate/nitrite transporter [Gorillibacterium sp. sgz5001074]|uniref:nitrate/nitrite transporter n=1 Tax=Gorillibacterium sp. sgz5001074 TaxID=3446695 RepID=UPI003F67F39F
MRTQRVQLPLQTVSLVLGFMVWVMLSSLMPFIKEDIVMNPTRIAWVTAVPVLCGSLLRILFGYWTNRIGARIMFGVSFVLLLGPVYFLSRADSFWDLIAGGLCLGLAGGVFSVGVTSLPKYYPKERHGFVNGIYGVGNLGTAFSTFGAPVLAERIGWQTTVACYMILLAVMAGANFLLGDRAEPKVATSLTAQIKGVYKNQKLWFLCLFYFITFGSFVAFSVYLPNFLVTHFGLTKVDAGLRTAGFIVLATFMRPVGGWLADRYDPFRILMLVFTGLAAAAVVLSFAPSMAVYSAGCLTIALCAGTGNGTIFKLVPLYFTKQAGIANGLISALGGLGGFFPPLMLAMLYNLTGHYAIGFMALSQVALASLLIVVYLYYQDRVRMAEAIIRSTGQAVMVTSRQGVVLSVNPAFTEVTGYSAEEMIGRKPSVLKSGRQSKQFYEAMWRDLTQEGCWQGEIWNRRANGEIYPEWLTVSSIKSDTGETAYYVAVFSDISEKYQEHAAAAHDPARGGSSHAGA